MKPFSLLVPHRNAIGQSDFKFRAFTNKTTFNVNHYFTIKQYKFQKVMLMLDTVKAYK